MAPELTLRSTVTLRGGIELPRLGLGVYQIPRGRETQRAVEAALELGYRHVDTARVYGNEQDVGAALRASGLGRDELFLTTKLWNADHGAEATRRACHESLGRLGVDRLDLFLIHWPVPGLRDETWGAMARLVEEGRCRAVGVSNYTVRHLEELLARSPVVPAVDQVELSPFLQQRELRAFCAARGIQVEAYSPLVRGERLGHPVVAEVAAKVGRSPAQALLRWGLQQGLVLLPKSSRRERIAENAAIFDFSLGAAEVAALDALEEGLHTCWDPTEAA